MIDTTFIAGFVPALLAGSYLHEYTHAAAARLAGGRARVDHIGLYCHWEIPASKPQWVDRVINLAPYLVGLTTVTAAVGVGWQPTDALGWLAVVTWLVYALGGGIEDYALSASYQQEWRGASLSARWDGLDEWQRLGLMALGIASSAVGLQALKGALGVALVWYAGDALLVAFAAVGAWAIIGAEQAAGSGE